MPTRNEILRMLRQTLVQILHKRAIEQFGRQVRYSIHVRGEQFDFNFRPDGTGFVEDRPNQIDFCWTTRPVSVEELLAIPEDRLQEIASRLFREEIAGKFGDPFVFNVQDLDAEPLEFLSGSQKELDALTTWICHREARLFDNTGCVAVAYTAASEFGAGGLSRSYIPFSERAIMLFDLAFEYNSFSGTCWEYTDGGTTRLSNYERCAQQITIKVPAPSAHERAEALLRLSEWLTGKVPEEERLALLRPDGAI